MDMMMTYKEAQRGQIMELLLNNQIDQREAAQRLGLCVRQIKRLLRQYRTQGLSGLISKQRGKPSNRRLSDNLRLQVSSLITDRYTDFGPTLACEKLGELHHIHISVETTRQIMLDNGLWKARTGAKIKPHQIRERRPRFGELIQIDGSPHRWFEDRAEACTLLVFIDDATGRLTQLRFVQAETTLDYMQVLHDHILAYGVPMALYSDRHSIFRINTKDSLSDSQTQFSRAAHQLGIECIHANSPQAKGRVERANQTLQDRLVKELRLADISDMHTANTWLKSYIKTYNQRFAVMPKSTEDAHAPWLGTQRELQRKLSIQTTRTLSKNLICQFNNKLYQVKISGSGAGMRGSKVTLHQHFDQTHEILWRERPLIFTLTTKAERQLAPADSKILDTRVNRIKTKRHTVNKPANNHPWKTTQIGKSVPDGVKRQPTLC